MAGDPHGLLSYTLRRKQGTVKLHIEAGPKLASGGVIFPWPATGKPGRILAGGKSSAWEGDDLRIRTLPAELVIASD